MTFMCSVIDDIMIANFGNGFYCGNSEKPACVKREDGAPTSGQFSSPYSSYGQTGGPCFPTHAMAATKAYTESLVTSKSALPKLSDLEK